MTDNIATNTPKLPSPIPKKKRSWRWFQITVGSIFAVILLLRLASCADSLDLEVRRMGAMTRDDDKAFEVANIGRSAITITGITINDRPECEVSAIRNTLFPLKLQIGDKQLMFSDCRIVRLAIRSDQGSATYTFNR